LVRFFLCNENVIHENDFLAGESGSADSVRDTRGFAIKMYTDEGLTRPRQTPDQT